MKIEKINENQLRIILTSADLAEYEIHLSQLDINAEKLHRLFRGMMELALSEHDFIVENTPLMVEASSLSPDSVMLIITKVPASQETAALHIPYQLKDKKGASQKTRKPENEDGISIFSFDTIDEAAGASDRICRRFHGLSSLFKMEDRYFLFIHNKVPEYVSSADLESVLAEYGQKHISTSVTQYYLYEHGEQVIKHNAVQALSQYIRA